MLVFILFIQQMHKSAVITYSFFLPSYLIVLNSKGSTIPIVDPLLIKYYLENRRHNKFEHLWHKICERGHARHRCGLGCD